MLKCDPNTTSKQLERPDPARAKRAPKRFSQIVGAGGDREAVYNPPRPLRRAHGRAEPALADLNHPYIPLPAAVAITARLPPAHDASGALGSEIGHFAP